MPGVNHFTAHTKPPLQPLSSPGDRSKRPHQLLRALLPILSITLAIDAFAADDKTPQATTPASSAATTPSEKDAGSDKLETVVVTAQKRNESVQKVPIPITVLGGDKVRESGISSASQVGSYVPNFSVERNNGHGLPRWNLRGLYTGDPTGTTVSPIGVYYDDIYISNVTAANRPLFDLERVEIARGPQGTLWGKNSTAGALNFISKKPTFNPDGYLKVDVGSYNRRKYEAAIGGALVDNHLAARLSLYDESLDGFGRNTYNGGSERGELNDQAIRLQVLAAISDDLDALVSVHHREYKTEGVLARATRFGTRPNGSDQFGYVGPTNGNASLNISGKAPKVIQEGVSARLNWQLGNLELVSISAFDDYRSGARGETDSDGGPYDLARSWAGIQRSKQASQEFRLSSPREDRWNWLLGLHYFYEDAAQTGATASLVNPYTATAFDRSGWEQTTRSYALFGSNTFNFTDKLSVTAGLRWSSETKDIDLQRRGGVAPVVFGNTSRWWEFESVTSPLQVTAQQNEKKTWQDFSWDITPEYQIDDNLRVYLRYARGFLSGGFNGGATNQGAVGLVDPEYLTDYEIGLKSEWLDGRLNINANAFYYDYEDIQTNIQYVYNNRYVSRRTNGGQGKVWGAELEIAAIPLDNLRVNLALAKLHTEYTDYVSGTTDYTGDEFGRSPEYSAILGANYRIPVRGGADTIVLDTNWNWRSSQWLSADHTDSFYRDDSRLLGQASLSYWVDRGDLKITVYADNVTDEKYKSNASPGGYQTRNISYAEPRTFGLSVTKQLF